MAALPTATTSPEGLANRARVPGGAEGPFFRTQPPAFSPTASGAAGPNKLKPPLGSGDGIARMRSRLESKTGPIMGGRNIPAGPWGCSAPEPNTASHAESAGCHSFTSPAAVTARRVDRAGTIFTSRCGLIQSCSIKLLAAPTEKQSPQKTIVTMTETMAFRHRTPASAETEYKMANKNNMAGTHKNNLWLQMSKRSPAIIQIPVTK